MEKEIYGNDQKEQLVLGKRDRLHMFLLAEGTYRGAILHGTKLVNEMRKSHDLGIMETLVLGHAYMGVLLMGSSQKGADRIGIKITCDGPIGGLSAEANAFGEVRGYLSHNPIPIDGPVESFDLAPYFGEGMLTVTRQLEAARHPFTSQIRLEHGNIAADLANFATRSEQVPSAYALSVKFDKAGEVVGAGGIVIQAMPGADVDNGGRLNEL